MSRFSVNRKWTLILALGLCIASSVVVSNAIADPVYEAPGDESGADGGTNGIGDPDVPDGAGRAKYIKAGVLSRDGYGYYGNRFVGDERGLGSSWMTRLYVVWRGTRSIWFRF